MADLSTNEKQVLEKLFQMGGGYVLNFSDRTIQEFFNDDVGVDIFNQKYNYASGSKANRMRGFWREANNPLVGESIIKLIGYIENQIFLGDLEQSDFPESLMSKGKEIGNRLLGRVVTPPDELTEDAFLGKELEEISVDSLGMSDALTKVLRQRLDEIRKCLDANAPLATIFLCGSTLEGILLGVATNYPKRFNKAKASPKVDGKVKRLPDWKLNELIDVARETGFIDEDVRKFSHALRDFRNYIHPHQQAMLDSTPDEQTARICSQVLLAAIVQVSRK